MSNQPIGPHYTPILLGTGNPAKQKMLSWLLEGLPFLPLTPSQAGIQTDHQENGDTHEAIARDKASDWSRTGGMLAIASDGGLVLPALGRDWESRYTHRFAGPAADDWQRVDQLLELLRPYQGAGREASWVEGLAIADQGQVLASWELQGATGVIADSPGDLSQEPGFWAFSVWYFPQIGKTYDQLSQEQRDSLEDHWTRLRHLVQSFLRGYQAG